MTYPADTEAVLLSFDTSAQLAPTQEPTSTWGFMCSNVEAAAAALRERKPAMVRAGDVAAVMELLAPALAG